MSESQTFGFAKLVPGFDFLQNLAKGAGGGLGQLPQLSSWVAPTLNVEELDKRIQELRAVHFWLEQNGKALAATIQALEVQRMTLSTLQGMNLSMGELAESLQLKPEMMAAGFGSAAPDGADAPAKPRPAADAPPSRAAGKAAKAAKAAKAGKAAPAGANGEAQVDPLQWWSSLSQQFQEIAATALKDVAEAGAVASPPPKSKAAKPAKPAPRAARKRAAASGRRRASGA